MSLYVAYLVPIVAINTLMKYKYFIVSHILISATYEKNYTKHVFYARFYLSLIISIPNFYRLNTLSLRLVKKRRNNCIKFS